MSQFYSNISFIKRYHWHCSNYVTLALGYLAHQYFDLESTWWRLS